MEISLEHIAFAFGGLGVGAAGLGCIAYKIWKSFNNAKKEDVEETNKIQDEALNHWKEAYQAEKTRIDGMKEEIAELRQQVKELRSKLDELEQLNRNMQYNICRWRANCPYVDNGPPTNQ